MHKQRLYAWPRRRQPFKPVNTYPYVSFIADDSSGAWIRKAIFVIREQILVKLYATTQLLEAFFPIRFLENKKQGRFTNVKTSSAYICGSIVRTSYLTNRTKDEKKNE